MIFAECKNIFPAMIKARSSVSEIVKDTRGNFGKYADLASINAAIMPALSANGLTVVQEVSTDKPDATLWVTVETWLCHASGEYIQLAPLSLPVGDKMTPQAVGSCITYGRRYALMAALNLSADDDDGEAAASRHGQAATDNRSAKPQTQARPPLRSEAPPEVNIAGMLPEGETPDDFLEWAATAHAQTTKGPATERMYGYLVSLIDGITEPEAHKKVLELMIHRPVSKENPPSYEMTSQLITWMSKEKGKKDEKVPNPDYDEHKVTLVRNIWGELAA